MRSIFVNIFTKECVEWKNACMDIYLGDKALGEDESPHFLSTGRRRAPHFSHVPLTSQVRAKEEQMFFVLDGLLKRCQRASSVRCLEKKSRDSTTPRTSKPLFIMRATKRGSGQAVAIDFITATSYALLHCETGDECTIVAREKGLMLLSC